MAMRCERSEASVVHGGAEHWNAVTKIVVKVVFFSYALGAVCYAQAPEPFAELHSYTIRNPPQPLSPDPLVRFAWSSDTNSSELQIYRVDRPDKYVVDPPSAMTGVESLDKNATGQPLKIVVKGEGTLMLDWAFERAAWLEFVSPDLENVDGATVTASISEYNSPYPGKTKPVTKYGTTYRLETNDELYEGVRFTWLYFSAPSKPWHITRLNLVAKIKPVSYTGSFSSSDDTLTASWYTGAYGVRLNMESDSFNSVLVERGDRVSIQGDGHPTMAAGLVAFSPYGLVYDMLVQTNSGFVHGHHVVDDTIMPYPIYWTMSVNDWYMASGDTRGFLNLAADAMSIIDKRVNDFLSDPNLVWMGWDDRLGDGWCSPGSLSEGGCGREAHLTFAGLVVRACNDLGRSLRLAGMVEDGERYQATAKRLGRRLRNVPEWPNGFGLHSAANVINAGSLVATPTEIEALFKRNLNDSVSVCSLSNFNQYWILQGLGNANKMEYALASIKLCWGLTLNLGKGCFWENFSPYWAAWMDDGDKAPIGVSYCHPWASGVTSWLTHAVGGVHALLPGYQEFVAAPYVSANYPRVETVVPTPAGKITVTAHLNGSSNHNHCSSDGICKKSITIKVDASTPGLVGVMKRIEGLAAAWGGCSINVRTVLLNGKPAFPLPAENFDAPQSIRASVTLSEYFAPNFASALLFLRLPTSGLHAISATYMGNCPLHVPSTLDAAMTTTTSASSEAGIPHFPPFPVPRYPATASLDYASSGDAISTYGADGYVLFGFKDGYDLTKFPAYVKNVTVRHHSYIGWSSLQRAFVGKSTNNSTFLPDPRPSHSGERALGSVGEEHSQLGRGIIIDVEIDEEQMTAESSMQLAVYCVAHSSTEKHAIQVQDRTNMNVIAPSLLVTNYTEGVWWSVRYNRSVRLRLMDINAARASAVAFVTASDSSFLEQEDEEAESSSLVLPQR